MSGQDPVPDPNPTYAPAGTIPNVNVGGGYMESVFARLDFAEKLLEEQKKQDEKTRKVKKELLDSGTVSVFDLEAPRYAVNEFNKASELLKQQKAKEAIDHLQKSIRMYPKFVSAHDALGLAYLDSDDADDAKAEFEVAVKLDEKFAGSLMNLGRLELSQKNYDAALSHVEKAAGLRPQDAKVLIVLAYAQIYTHQYNHAIDTAVRVHALPHKDMANVHYVAASAAIALKDFPTVRRELQLFMQEDPTNPLTPSAQYNLKILASAKIDSSQPSALAVSQSSPRSQSEVKTFPNSDALKNALASLGDDDDSCGDCYTKPEGGSPLASLDAGLTPVPNSTSAVDGRRATGVWKIREVIDEVAVFFAVTNRGKLVNDLEARDLEIRDDNKPPTKVLQFAPQSKLPLRLGLLIDTSGSLQKRFAFEKMAATQFVEGMLQNPSDLAFVAGFSNGVNFTQDFTGDGPKLAKGIDDLTIAGGTAIWDAVSRSCWKLAAYPEKERVAKVLVVLTDGEDNASSTSLKKTIQDAENTGVTVYVISTEEYDSLHKYGLTDADRVLQALAERTGGEALFPGEIASLQAGFNRLREVIRSRYLIAYKPSALQPNGKFRSINILANKNGKHLKVYARRGYYAPLEANR